MRYGFADGWETLNLINGGLDRYTGPSGADCSPYYLQISASLKNSQANGYNASVGLAEVLFKGYFVPSLPAFGAGQHPLTGPTNTDWGSATIYNPNGFASSGSGPEGWGHDQTGNIGLPIFSVIMAAQLPTPAFWSEVIYFPSDLIVPAGSYLVLHADAVNLGPSQNKPQVDFETQGVLVY